MALLPEEIYQEVWGAPPDASQPFTHDDLTRDLDEPQEDPPREDDHPLWGVIIDGVPLHQLYPSEDFAHAGAAGAQASYPAARIEIRRVRVDWGG